MSDVTRILSQIESGDPSAAEQLLPLIYDELRKLAAAKLAQEKPGQTLQATALVHEAYLRLIKPGVGSQESRASEATSGNEKLVPGSRPLAPVSWNSRGHFFAAAAEAMRRILVERARQQRGPKRGGGRSRVELEQVNNLADSSAEQILAVHEALDHLAEESPRAAELVKLRYFGGLPHAEAADALGISRATADRLWAYAKAALYCDLAGEGD